MLKDRWREVPMLGPTDPTLPDIGFMLEASGVPRLLFYILANLYGRTEFDNACNIDTVEYFPAPPRSRRIWLCGGSPPSASIY